MELDAGKKELFETLPAPKAVLKMSIPTVIGSLVMLIYSLADTFFVGSLNDPVQSAAVTLASPVLLAFNAINNLFGIGSSSYLSRSLGAGDYETAKRAGSFGIYCAAICGVAFSLVSLAFCNPILSMLGTDATTYEATYSYFFWTVICGAMPSIVNVVMGYMVKAEGCALHASIGTMSGCILNMILDPFFILPRFLNMGVEGAGLATFISNCFAVTYFVVLSLVKGKKTFVSVNPKDFKPSKALFKGVCGVGIPAAIQNLLNVVGQTVFNNFAAPFGAAAVTAVGLSAKGVMIPTMIFLGVSNGIMPLISYNYMAKNKARMKDVLSYAMKISIIGGVVLALPLFFKSGFLISLFIENEEVIEIGGKFLRCLSPVSMFMTIDFIGVGFYNACGKGKISLLFAILRKIVLEIPAIILFNKLWPLYGMAFAQPVAELVLAIAAVFMIRKIFKEMN